MDTSAAHGVGGRVALGIAVAAALLATVWWGVAGLGTENFGSDCLFYYGETGPRAEHCYEVNDRAEAWLPRLVVLAWVGAALSLVLPGLPRLVLPGESAGAAGSRRGRRRLPDRRRGARGPGHGRLPAMTGHSGP